mmetsp:Transcript_11285/g.35776  ORF Transcript_11285/g.35776 Transcript_11285/m.35776 type:complete len:106 (-) Transcript_11285:774-1091(-)
MWSATGVMAARRWATTRRVALRSLEVARRAETTSASVCESWAEVGSSARRRGASRRRARAMWTRWRSPPERREPRSPTGASRSRWSRPRRAARALASSEVLSRSP